MIRVAQQGNIPSKMSKLILFLSIFLIASFTEIEINLDGKSFYWRHNDSSFPMNGAKSVIEFQNGYIRIIDYSFDIAGPLLYQIGTFQYDNVSQTVQCEIFKRVSLSLNTGTVTSYAENCTYSIPLQIDNGEQFLRYGIQDSLEMNYNIFDKNNPPFNYKWTYRLSSYHNIDKLTACNVPKRNPN